MSFRTLFLSLSSVVFLSTNVVQADAAHSIDDILGDTGTAGPSTAVLTPAKPEPLDAVDLLGPSTPSLTVEEQKEKASKFAKGKLIGESVTGLAKEGKEADLGTNTKTLWGGLKSMYKGGKQLACGLRDEAINIGQGVRGGAYLAVAGAKALASQGIEAYGWLTGEELSESLTTRAAIYRASSGEFYDAAGDDIEAALKRTPEAFIELGAGSYEFVSGAYYVVKAGKPIYDFAVEASPYVAAVCAVALV